jgi:5-(carboxyamino)imidazole ribonucleotide mutase
MGSARVAVIMGSDSDWPVMKDAAEVLAQAGIEVVSEVVSAHRTPEKMVDFAKNAADRGFSVVIAGAGGAAHLPGMVASLTPLPVIGVPVPLATLDGMDSLLSIVQMPPGIPVATVGIGQARNAGILAMRILALANTSVATFLKGLMESQTQASLAKVLPQP